MHVIVADDAGFLNDWQLTQEPEGMTVTKGEMTVAFYRVDADTLSFRLFVNTIDYRITEHESSFVLKKES